MRNIHKLIWCLLLLVPSLACAKPAEVGRVIMATQGVTAQLLEQQPRNLARRSVVYAGDLVVTPAGGKAQIRLADGEMISLAASTELELTEFSYQPGSQDAPNKNIKYLITGGLKTVTGAVKGDAYQLQTRAGTIGIRGTSFEAMTEQGQNLFVNMQSGTVAVSNAQGSIEVSAGDGLSAVQIESANQPPQAIAPSQLPANFNDTFSEEPSLGVAEPEADTLSASSTENTSSTASDSIFAASIQGLATNTFDVKEQALNNLNDNEKNTNNFRSETDSETPPSVNVIYTPLKGVVVGGHEGDLGILATSGPDYQFINGVFNSILFDTESQSFAGEDGVGFDEGSYIQKFNFQNLVQAHNFELPAEVVEGNDDLAMHLERQLNGFDDFSGIWHKFSLGDADIYEGGFMCKNGCINESEGKGWYMFAFSDKALSLNEFLNVSSRLGEQEFVYELRTDVLTSGLASGNLIVNFNKSKISANLRDNNGFGYEGAGSISEFYAPSGLNLNQGHGQISGYFVGSEAQGAIANYLLLDVTGKPNKTGIAIFER